MEIDTTGAGAQIRRQHNIATDNAFSIDGRHQVPEQKYVVKVVLLPGRIDAGTESAAGGVELDMRNGTVRLRECADVVRSQARQRLNAANLTVEYLDSIALDGQRMKCSGCAIDRAIEGNLPSGSVGDRCVVEECHGSVVGLAAPGSNCGPTEDSRSVYRQSIPAT